jgi:hypothetical protein
MKKSNEKLVNVNPDLAKERHSNLDLQSLKLFLGRTQFNQPGEYENIIAISCLY